MSTSAIIVLSITTQKAANKNRVLLCRILRNNSSLCLPLQLLYSVLLHKRLQIRIEFYFAVFCVTIPPCVCICNYCTQYYYVKGCREERPKVDVDKLNAAAEKNRVLLCRILRNNFTLCLPLQLKKNRVLLRNILRNSCTLCPVAATLRAIA